MSFESSHAPLTARQGYGGQAPPPPPPPPAIAATAPAPGHDEQGRARVHHSSPVIMIQQDPLLQPEVQHDPLLQPEVH